MNLYRDTTPATACCVACRQEVQVYYVLTYPGRGRLGVVKRFEPHLDRCTAKVQP